MKPIVVLNSGGFDSVLLLHELRGINPTKEIHTLYFNYGQQTEIQENACALKSSQKLGCIFHALYIPNIDWTKNKFYEEGFAAHAQYLEMRNLIFLSYALSLSESIGADKIYAAYMKPQPMNSGFNDTSFTFVEKFDDLAVNTAGVHFYAPMMEYDKEDLIAWVANHKITPNDFFSCDTPVSGRPCKECPDCKILLQIFPKNY